MTLLHPTDAARSFPGFAPIGEVQSGQALRQRTARPLSEERLTDMSKRTDKLSYVAPQADIGVTTPFAQVLADFEAINARVNEWYERHEEVVVFNASQKAELAAFGWTTARDKVFATPALTAADLAGKIATLYELPGLFDYHPQRLSHQEIVSKGSDADQALLTCYLDALSLGGAVPKGLGQSIEVISPASRS